MTLAWSSRRRGLGFARRQLLAELISKTCYVLSNERRPPTNKLITSLVVIKASGLFARRVARARERERERESLHYVLAHT